MSHDDPDHDIPDYLTARLDAEGRRRLEEHLADCDMCTETISVGGGFVDALREGGEAIWEDEHPSAEQIRAFASGPTQIDGGRLAVHVAVCARCTLEVDFWRARRSSRTRSEGMGEGSSLETVGSPGSGPGGDSLRAARGSRATIPPLLVGVAAGAILGVALSSLLVSRGILGPRHGPGPSGGGVSAGEAWRGIPVSAPLDLPSRSEGRPSVVRIGPRGSGIDEDPPVLLLIPLELPPTEEAEVRVTVEIHDSSGRVAWTTELSRGDLAARTAGSPFLPLLVPSADLVSGSYELTVRSSRDAAEALVRIPFDVKH